MKKDFETRFAGWAFIVASILLLGGWSLLSHHIGEYIIASDFEEVGKNVWYWIWMYRVHIFGWVTMGVALFALSTITAKTSSRVLVLPGAGVIIVGTFTLALAAAFYYNFGAWGVGETADKSPEEVDGFMNSILSTNQYVTCFVRFGRIFSGVGMVLLGWGFIKGKIMSSWLGWYTAIYGFAVVVLILAIPDHFEIYKPFFYLKTIWLAIMGVMLLRNGLQTQQQD